MNMQKNDKDFYIAFFLNFIMVILEIVGLVLSIERHGLNVFYYFTENSNYLTLLISLLFCIYSIIGITNNKKIPRWIYTLRFVSTISLSITFCVVLFLLIPMYPDTWFFMLFGSSNLYQHLLCPLISITSFIAFERNNNLEKTTIFISIVPILIYGIVLILLNIFRITEGPYPFFYVYKFPIYLCAIICVSIVIFAIAISIVLYKISNTKTKKQEKHIKN